MTDYTAYCVGSWRAGEHGYYEALRDRPRGHAVVQHDNKVWLYDLRQGRTTKLRDFRAFLKSAWESGHTIVHGAYPNYTIETRN